jgi:predicted amidohydrolase YtcJ
LILDILGHAAVVNSMAMKLVGYDILQMDPLGGKKHRDPETGETTGMLGENFQRLFRFAAFPPTTTN